MPANWIFWLLFNLFVLLMLALDLGVFHRRKHVIAFPEAIGWTMVWVALAGAFAVLIYYFGHTLTGGPTKPNSELALEFVTAYLIEESLSVDNLFVFLVIFRYFAVPRKFQHEVLFWGVVGALVMRGIFILVGIKLLNAFAWVIYVFGAILIYSGIKLFRQADAEIDPGRNIVLRWFRKLFRVTGDYEGDKFFVLHKGIRFATPLAVVLVMIETTDVLFATDSIPAVLAISREPFIVFTSNVFAILGLRSLYFALAGMIEVFHLLHYGLSVILIFIGVKMLASHYVRIPIGVALGVVAGVLLISVVLSLIFPRKAKAAA
ncbi:MAG TPA: TerC family protein [Candidatus Eisenbacteria bacterium]|nr:TerC family protein [Candidatus Eisenbacteria bacterium]